MPEEGYFEAILNIAFGEKANKPLFQVAKDLCAALKRKQFDALDFRVMIDSYKQEMENKDPEKFLSQAIGTIAVLLEAYSIANNDEEVVENLIKQVEAGK